MATRTVVQGQDKSKLKTMKFGRFRRSGVAILLLVAVSAFALVIFAGQAVKKRVEQPLGPTLALILDTPGPEGKQVTTGPVVANAVEGSAGSEDGSTGSSATVDSRLTQVPLQTPTEGPKPVCGGPDHMIILAIGADNTSGYYRGLADVIRAVRVDFANPGISILSVPRDLWVEIPGIEELRGTSYGKANQPYFFGNLYRMPGGGPVLLAQTLYNNIGLISDHYVAVNMSVFVKAVDSVGGIDLYLPYAVYDNPDKPPAFYAGWHHFNGTTALEFSRLRKADSEWNRQRRQMEVLLALRKQVLKPENLPKLPSLAFSSLEEVLTSLSISDISKMICLLPKINEENVRTYLIEYDMITPAWSEEGMWIALPHEEEIRARVADFMDDGIVGSEQ